MCACVLSRFSCVQLFVTLCAVDLQAPLSVGTLQVWTLEWVVLPSSRGSSWPRDQTHPLTSPALTDGFFTTSTSWEALSEVHQPVILLKLSTSRTLMLWSKPSSLSFIFYKGYPILPDNLDCSVVPRYASSFHVSASLLLWLPLLLSSFPVEILPPVQLLNSQITLFIASWLQSQTLFYSQVCTCRAVH